MKLTETFSIAIKM